MTPEATTDVTADVTATAADSANPVAMQVALGLVIHVGRVLLHRRRAPEIREYHDGWELPGGKVEQGETAAQAAVREVGEETGQKVEVVSFLPFAYRPPAALSRRRSGLAIEVVCVQCRWIASLSGPALAPAARWFAIDDVPWSDMIPGSREFLLEALAQHLGVPGASGVRRVRPYTLLFERGDDRVHVTVEFRARRPDARYLITQQGPDEAVSTSAYADVSDAFADVQARVLTLQADGHRLSAVDARHPLTTWLADREMLDRVTADHATGERQP